MITQLLEEAFSQATKLPSEEQDALASLMMEEMSAKKKWDDAFSNSQDRLSEMGQQALAEHKTAIHGRHQNEIPLFN